MGLKAGFAKADITPGYGYPLDGYFYKRYADGILDNLYTNVVVFDDGERKAAIVSLDCIGNNQVKSNIMRKEISEKTGLDFDAIYLACTHTHLSPGFGWAMVHCTPNDHEKALMENAFETMVSKTCDAIMLAIEDLKPAKLSYCKGEVDDISFIRRYKMIDGSPCSFPDEYGEFVVGAFAEIDKEVQHLIIEREGGYNIGIVNFGVHADAIGGSKISADFPQFVRRTYEKLLDNTHCMFITGAQGDCNSKNIALPMDHPMKKSYKKSQWMGKKIAMAAISNMEFAEPLDGDKISFGHKNVMVKLNKGTPEEVEFARKMLKVYKEESPDAATLFVSKEKNLPLRGEYDWVKPAEHAMKRYNVIARLADSPDRRELCLSAISVGDVVFAGFPGEPFTDVGRQLKQKSKFQLTIPSSCTNGFEGYFPTKDAFEENGYEANTTNYAYGTAETLLEAALDLFEEL